jgi:hypothetical protein
MTNLNEILKPKNEKEVSEEIQKLNMNEFLFAFSKSKFSHVRKLKIGFKKKWRFFFIFYLPKFWQKLFWPFWGIWILITIWSDILIPYGSLWGRGPIDIIDNLMTIGIYIAWIPLLFSLFYGRSYLKYTRSKLQQSIRDVEDLMTELARNRDN